MESQRWLMFDGLMSGVRLNVDQRFDAAIGAVFSGWPFEIEKSEPSEAFAAVGFDGDKYTVSSPFMDSSEKFGDPVNALCRLVVEVAWAQLRERPEMLCVHGAAVEINGRLVVFPSTRRTGKSTFSLGMMAAGQKLYTDDFLPLLVNAEKTICGFSEGISPRLRLPLPKQVGRRTTGYFNRQKYIENRQYRYVVPKPGDAASYGEIAPIGALVFLSRKEAATPKLTRIKPEEALQYLITQNFARSMNASSILEMLYKISTGVPAYRLSFSGVDEAVDTISNRFNQWSSGPATIDDLDCRQAPDIENRRSIENWHSSSLVQMADVTEKVFGEERFLSGNSDRDIVHLNECASGIWNLLAQPITFAEILEVLSSAFPDQSPERLTVDAQLALQSFVDHQLVREIKTQGGMPTQMNPFTDNIQESLTTSTIVASRDQ